jgi:hypothetical protein
MENHVVGRDRFRPVAAAVAVLVGHGNSVLTEAMFHQTLHP